MRLTSLILLAIKRTPATASPVLMCYVGNTEVKGERDGDTCAGHNEPERHGTSAGGGSQEAAHIYVHRCSHTNNAPTRTSAKLSSASRDITETMLSDDWFPCFVPRVNPLPASVSLSLEDSGMLLTFSRRITRSACWRWGAREDRLCISHRPVVWLGYDRTVPECAATHNPTPKL